MHKRILIPVIILIIIAVGGGLWWRYHRPEASVDISTIKASGFIESTNVGISPEISGRIISIACDEGDQVTPGEAVIKLDDSIQQAQLKQAQAALHVAQASLQQAQAALPVAQAALQQAQAAQTRPKFIWTAQRRPGRMLRIYNKTRWRSIVGSPRLRANWI